MRWFGHSNRIPKKYIQEWNAEGRSRKKLGNSEYNKKEHGQKIYLKKKAQRTENFSGEKKRDEGCLLYCKRILNTNIFII